MFKKVKKGVAVSIGLAAMARKKAEKELKKKGISRKRVKGVAKKIGCIALREGKRVEKILMNEIAKEMKKARPKVKKAVKKSAKRVKRKAKRVLKRVRRRR